MRIFENNKHNLHAIGLAVDGSSRYEFVHHARAVLICTLGIVSQFLYALLSVNTVEEYMRCIFMITTGIGAAISYYSVIERKTELHALIDSLQIVVGESK